MSTTINGVSHRSERTRRVTFCAMTVATCLSLSPSTVAANDDSNKTATQQREITTALSTTEPGIG